MNEKLKSAQGKIIALSEGKHTGTVITKNKSTLIIMACIGIVLIYIIIFFCTFITNKSYDVSPTEFRTEIKINDNLCVTPLKSIFAPSTQKMLVFFTVDDINTGYQTEFETVSYLRANKVLLLPSKVLYKEDEIMVVEIQNVPNNFIAVRLDVNVNVETPIDIIEDETTLNKEEKTATIIMNETNTTYVKSVSNVPNELKVAYKIFAQDDVKIQIDTVDKQISEQEKKISSAQVTIDKIDEKLIDLPDDEAKEAAQIRKQKENEIAEAKKQIEELKQQRNTLSILIQNYENRYK